jgi:hypothetical protein
MTPRSRDQSFTRQVLTGAAAVIAGIVLLVSIASSATEAAFLRDAHELRSECERIAYHEMGLDLAKERLRVSYKVEETKERPDVVELWVRDKDGGPTLFRPQPYALLRFERGKLTRWHVYTMGVAF